MENNVAITAIFIPIVSVVSIALLIFYLRKLTSDERMAMIEKGLAFPEKKPQKLDPSGILTAGFLFFGAGVGLVWAKFISSNFPEDEAVSIYFGMILIFGGLGLLISYFIQYRMAQKEKKNE